MAKQYIVFSEIGLNVWKQVKVSENLKIAKDIAKRNHDNGYASLVEDELGNVIYDPSPSIFDKKKNPRDIHIDIDAHNVRRNPSIKKSARNYGDDVRDKMLVKMINGAIEDALKRKNAKDYSKVNGYLGYAQGVIATALKVKAITASEAKQFKAQIKQIAM